MFLERRRSELSSAVEVAYIPAVLLVAAFVVVAAARSAELAVAATVLVAVGLSFAAERGAPYEPAWNRSRLDGGRDLVHAVVNESSTAIGLVMLPVLTDRFPWSDRWPRALPFVIQVLGAVVVLDIGITLVHRLSHQWAWLWRFHAVHHSVRRLYGFNGLMKHPIHQMIETGGGMAPLVLLGVPTRVAIAVAGLVVLQLLLQHSNVAYRVGWLGRWWALNEGHRLHHLDRTPDGDVNFGLFLLVWDRLLGTYVEPTLRVVGADEVGLADPRGYPTGYVGQLFAPFSRR